MQVARSLWPMLGLLAQSGLARLSDQMAAIVYGWGLLKETESSAVGGLVMAASFGALVLGTLFAGRLIGRYGARSVALAGVWLSVTAAAVIAILLSAGIAHPAVIAALAAAGALLDGPSAIASETHYPQIARLARFDLIRLNAIDDGLDGTATLVAPPVGVALVTLFGLAGGASAVALIGLMAALILTISFPRFLPIVGTAPTTLRTICGVLLADRLLTGLTLLFSVAVGVFVAVELVVLPRLLLGTAQEAGLLTLFLVTGALAALAGAALSRTLAARLRLRTLLAAAFVSLAIGMVLLAISAAVPVIVASAFLSGLPSGLLGPLAASIYQLRPPRALRADVQALSGALVFAAAPVAVLAAGFAVDVLPTRLVLLALAGLMAVGALLATAALPPGTAMDAMQKPPSENRQPSAADPPAASPDHASRRSPAIDALRGAALFGIILVNAPFFAGPSNGLPMTSWLDATAVWLTGAFFAGKFFLIFSFLFGFGFATQLLRAEREGTDIRAKFLRRLLGLFVLGGLHACFLFFGDILMLYAVLGLLLWCCRGWPKRRLMATAFVAYLAGIALQTAALMSDLEVTTPSAIPSLAPGVGYLGGFAEVAATRMAELPESLGFIVAFNGLPALAMFLAGLALGRDGTFPPTPATLQSYGRHFAWALAIGASISGIAMWSAMTGSLFMAGMGFAALATVAPLLSFGLAGLTLMWILGRPDAPMVFWLTRAGCSSLSCYILHSVILGAVFYGWGLGNHGALGAAAVSAIAVATFLAVVVLLGIWRRYFRFGPDEWLLRSFTDLQWKKILAD